MFAFTLSLIQYVAVQLDCALSPFVDRVADALADTDTLEPRPDYYTAVLFQRLMGTRVLPVSISRPDPDLHIYAHCSGSGSGDSAASATEQSSTSPWTGDVAFAFLNRSPDKTFEVTLTTAEEDSSSPTFKRSEFHLASANRSDVFSSKVFLNGAPLSMDGWAKLPPLKPKEVDGTTPLRVASQTVGFVILHGARAQACTTADH